MFIYFSYLLHTTLSHFLGQESNYTHIQDIPLPESDWLSSLIGEQEMSFDEQVVLLLALMPHTSPQTLDPLFLQNKKLDRPYTEFGGWRGTSHQGFLPTGETAAFILSVDNTDKRQDVIRLFERDHWFHTKSILHLEGQGRGEPFLSGRLIVSDEFLAKVLHDNKYCPDYSSDFPAKRVTTTLERGDLVLPYNLQEDLNDISLWLQNEQKIRSLWQLDKIIKQGYRCLFYGPPGTGKTLTASLLGKQHGMEVYRIDLSQVVSKYIGETEKNLANIFDRAEHQNWILFFDEADALFGKRTDTNTSNDRHANQEVAYLLQRVEDFPGMVILATNLKENIDEAFFRRFQSVLYFPMPDERLRYQLWKQMIPVEWLSDDELLHVAAEYKLSGGSMVNVIQNCAIRLYSMLSPLLTKEILEQAIAKEESKDGKMINK
ncbi:AAA family ATPase [Dysgonomonas sp. ZJ279]|uniref:AAA family ATPase n=1 Tax=Dysgonomonas sp. ZJ279 TaxID=2709796 RepID=UPI0013EDEB56|nr:AAA family ATPase [Dysgonomonas sp. ZJ279]